MKVCAQRGRHHSDECSMTVSLDNQQRIKAACLPLAEVKGKITCKRNSVRDLVHKQEEVEELVTSKKNIMSKLKAS